MTAATTGVGSLPHADPHEAARFVLDTVEVPYLPQLPVRHPQEGMLAQWGDGLCGCGSGGLGLGFAQPQGRSGEAFVGARALIEHLPADTPALKLQATGPVTLASAMRAGGHPGTCLRSCVLEGLVERVNRHVEWVRSLLRDADLTLVLDEPALAALDGWSDMPASDAFSMLAEAIAAIDGPVGLHCCGDTDWTAVARLRPAVLSLDLSALGPRFSDAATDLAIAVSGGMRMIWGVVPAQAPPLPDTASIVERVRRAEGILVLAGADFRSLADCWITPGCGLAALTVDQATAVVGRVADVAAELRRPL